MNNTNQNMNTPIDNQGEQQEVIRATVICAASSGQYTTGLNVMYKLKGDTSKEWAFIDRSLPAPYKNEVALLTGFAEGIQEIAKAVLDEKPKARLEITCITYHASILTGVNKNRKTWEANGYITSRGNRVKHKAAWKQLFILADKYNVIFKKPEIDSKLMKACTNRAKMVLREND